MERLPDPLSAVARIDPLRPFVVAPTWTLTYGEADRRVEHASAALQRAGLTEGDRLALYDPGGPPEQAGVLRDILLMLACWRVGIVAVPLSGRMPPAAIDRAIERLGGAIRTDEERIDPDSLFQPDDTPTEPAHWHLDRPATVLLTSGTMTEPKAAAHTLGNHVWSARGWYERVPLTPADRWLLDLPLNHVAGLSVLFRCVLAGASIALRDRSMPLSDAVLRLGVTCISFVSTQLRRALDSNVPLDHLKLVLLGGSAFSSDMLREARDRRWPVSVSYGLTEMASTVTATPPDPSVSALATAGTVLPFREIEIAPGGEIRVRGSTLFSGYLSGGSLTVPFDREGWFHTGDLGEWYEIEGRSMLRVVGRKDNMFVSGGENVQPEAIETVLLRQPGVERAVVVPVADAEFGHRPLAFIAAPRWEPEAWARAATVDLPRFMVPVSFLPWPRDGGEDARESRSDLLRRAGALR